MATTNEPPISDADALQAFAREYQGRIQRAIFKISEQAPAALRAVLDTYLRKVSPQLAREEDSQFPTALRPAARNPERHNAPSGMVIFHVANSIIGYYKLVQGLDVLEVLDTRVKLLEQIAEKNYKNFTVIGNDGDGYTLIHKDEKPVKFLTPKQGEEQLDPDQQ